MNLKFPDNRIFFDFDFSSFQFQLSTNTGESERAGNEGGREGGDEK